MRSFRGPHLFLSLLSILWVATPVHAQEPPKAVMRLIRQTAWTTPEKPLLEITVRITNDGEATITDPVVGWTLGPKVTSRDQYESTLDEGPAFPASAETDRLPADLPPGGAVRHTITIDTSETGGIIQDDSAVYPLQLELRSQDRPISAITTAAIHIFQDPPRKPIVFSWWTEVATPIAFGPDGTLIDPGFEQILESRGGVVTQVDAIAQMLRTNSTGTALDVVVSPAALEQLEQAQDGYERSDGTSVPKDAPAPLAAADTLSSLIEIARDPAARLHAMPFAAPRLPALLSAGLREHLETQWRTGEETFERILGEAPDPTVSRPPGLALDQASVDFLEERGVTTILGGAETVERPLQENGFAPPPAATLTTSAGGTVSLLLPDPGAQTLLADPGLREDPVRAAQVVLGELATIWKERPVPPADITRGLALDLFPDLPTGILRELVRKVSLAPFLQPVQAEEMASLVQPPPLDATLGTSAPGGFTSGYSSDLAVTDRRVITFASILEEPVGEADRLHRWLQYAEASQYVDNEGSGRMWIRAVNDVIDRTFSRLKPDTARVLTFTSRTGTIPLRMGDPGGRVLNVKIELASGRVDFLDGNVRPIRLDQANQVVTFRAEVKAAGPSNIDVLVTSPTGQILTRGVLVVRSTAVNPIALIITAGAGLVLIGLWSRRLFRRRRP